MQGLLGDSLPPFNGNAWPDCHHGQVCSALPPSSRASVAGKGPAWPYQGQGACQQEQEDGLGLLWLQCQLHCGCHGQVLESFQPEEAGDGSQGLVVPLDDIPVHTATMVSDWMAARLRWSSTHLMRWISPQPTSSCYPGWRGSWRSSPHPGDRQEGVGSDSLSANFATALRQWYKRCEKFVDIARSYVEKS